MIALVSVLVLPCGSALASESLLSGYGGPGGGEQVVIGAKVLPPTNGDGSLSVGSQSTPSSTSESQPSTEKRAKPNKESADDSSTTTTTGSRPSYPAESSAASGLPLATDDLPPLLIGAGAIGLIALFFRRNGSAGL